MAKLTTIQIDKYNAQCENGFKFDFQYYLYHKEKTLIKYIDLESNQVLKASILYHEDNKKQVPTLHLHKGVSSGEFYSFFRARAIYNDRRSTKNKKVQCAYSLN